MQLQYMHSVEFLDVVIRVISYVDWKAFLAFHKYRSNFTVKLIQTSSYCDYNNYYDHNIPIYDEFQ